MKTIFYIFLLLVFGILTQSFLPWWITAPTAAIVGLIAKMTSWKSFGIGFLAMSLLWGGYAFWQHQSTGGFLTNRIAELFGGIGAPALILICALLGGILGGMGMLCGGLARKLIS